MKSKLKITFVSIITFIYACSSDENNNVDICDQAQELVEGFFIQQANNSDYYIFNGVDLQTHEYSFKTTQGGEICSLGYQGNDTNDYLMEIYDETNAVSLYSGNHSFSDTQLSYVSIPSVPIQTGHTYTIKRTRVNYTNLSELVGRTIRDVNFQSIVYPQMFGDIELTVSNFYGAGGPLNDFAIPYITFGFIPN